MKTLTIIILALSLHLTTSAQVIIDGKDQNPAGIIQVYAFKKPFSSKESLFANTGENDFKLHFYDSKRQSIHDADGNKFEKGEYLKLFKYLKTQGWEKIDEHEEKLGNNKGRVITFERAGS